MAEKKKEKYQFFARHNLGAFAVELFIRGGYNRLAYTFRKPTLEVYISERDQERLVQEGIKLYASKKKVGRLIKRGRSLTSGIRKAVYYARKNNFKKKTTSELKIILRRLRCLDVEMARIYRFTEVIYTVGVERIIREFVRRKIKSKDEVNHLLAILVNSLISREVELKRKKFIAALKMPPEIISLCQSVREIGKERILFRSALNDSTESLFILLHEIGRRSYFAPSQIEACFYNEIVNLLHGEKVNISKINERARCFAALRRDKTFVFYTKEKAERIISEIVPKLRTNIKELKGDIASLGIVKGRVKIIPDLFSVGGNKLLNQKIGEMKKGEILVTTTSGPEMIVACKKAAAIVAEEGGINSHAAVVSRELGIPCIINTKIAVQVLKDGDLIEVDADRGIVKILKRK